MKVKITDVAKASGVSIATVSHVINHTRYVSPETTRKVEKAIHRNLVFREKNIPIPEFSMEDFDFITGLCYNSPKKSQCRSILHAGNRFGRQRGLSVTTPPSARSTIR